MAKTNVNKNNKEELLDVGFYLDNLEMFDKGYSFKPDETEFPKVRAGQVIDEEKSVRWNREEVERRINARKEEEKRLQQHYYEVRNSYLDDIKKALMRDYRRSITSDKEFSILWAKAYENGHSCGYREVVNYFEEYADMYTELLEARNNNKNTK